MCVHNLYMYVDIFNVYTLEGKSLVSNKSSHTIFLKQNNSDNSEDKVKKKEEKKCVSKLNDRILPRKLLDYSLNKLIFLFKRCGYIFFLTKQKCTRN